jgi:hypothetical protein
MMNIQSASNRLSILGSLALLLTAGVVGCSSPVATPDESPATPLSKKSTTTSNAWETEPNNDPSTANVIGTATSSGGRMGYVSSATDNDYFVTAAIPAGAVLAVNLAMPSTKDYDVQVLSSDGVTVLASNHQGAGISETIRLTNTSSASQTYILRVFSADGSSSTVSPYTLIAGKAS